MLRKLKTTLRRTTKGLARRHAYPIALPHHRLIDPTTLQSLNLPPRPISAHIAKLLPLCTGQHTLAEVAAQAAVPRAAIIEAHESELLILWPTPVPADLPAPDRAPHSIILSPHPDDAALSCGGRLLADPHCLVLNIFSQAAWWRFPHTDADRATIQATRAAEDALASRLTRIPFQALDLPEALLRGHPMDTIFTSTPDHRDESATASLAQALADLAAAHPLVHWYIPEAVGRHIDHRIVRDTALKTLQSASLPPSHLHLYEDLPYAAKKQTSDLRQQYPKQPWRPEHLDIDDHIDAKLELLRVYWSQLPWSQLPELKHHAQQNGNTIESTQTPSP